MSSSASSSNSSNDRQRETAKRTFAEEFADATEMFREGGEDRAPKFAILPTGERANRVFVVGTLTETADIGENDEYWQGRVVDPTGTFYLYAGQYQPEAMSVLRTLETPEFVAVVGKPRVYEPDDGDVLTSLRPESVTVVPEYVRDQWTVETAEHTLARIDAFESDESSDANRARNAYGEDLDMADYRAAVKTGLASIAGIEMVKEDEDESDD